MRDRSADGGLGVEKKNQKRVTEREKEFKELQVVVEGWQRRIGGK